MKALRSLIYLLVASSMILLASCAKPNYEDPQRNPAVEENGTCRAYLAQSNVCIDLIWDKKPSKEAKGSFYLEFYNPADRSQFIDLQNDLEVVLWMPSMGHGSAPVKVEKTNPGQYLVSDVYFVMPGDWEIQIKLKNGATVLEQTALPYRY
ncbi:MAG: FixH family protein [Bdellovibrionales bacterium]|nr:FixH family protein [Bdellovibrionales bacterium]